MNPRIRKIVFVVVAVLLGAGVVAWWLSGFSLDFSRFFAADPGAGTLSSPTPTPFSTPPTSLVGCTPETQTVSVDEAATLTATGGAGSYQWFAPDGVMKGFQVLPGGEQISIGVQVAVTYAIPGTKKVTVRAARGDSSGNTDSVACTVVVTP